MTVPKKQLKPKQTKNYKEKRVVLPESGEFSVCHTYKIKQKRKVDPPPKIIMWNPRKTVFLFLERISTTADLIESILEILLRITALKSKY